MSIRAQIHCAVLSAIMLCGCARDETSIAPNAHVPEFDGGLASKAACSMCHLYPEPAQLEKRAWMPVMGRMKLLCGMEEPDIRRMNNPELADNTNVFPAAPLFSPNLWQSIEAYYFANSPVRQPPLNREPLAANLSLFRKESLAFSIPVPATTFVSLNSPGVTMFADGRTKTIYSVLPDGSLSWSLPVSNIVTSLRSVGGRNYIVGIGSFFPADDLLGELLLHQPADGLNVKSVLKNLPRVTHLELADLNVDGRPDFALSIFGNLLGRFSWFEQTEEGLKEHRLFEKPGALKSIAHDFDDDGLPDLAVLVAQATEALIIFRNQGGGKFESKQVFQKSPVYGHTDFELADFNNDGQLDFVVTNGDNADFQTQPRPYHGVRIYVAEGSGYNERFFFPFYGAYQVVARDFDLDGDQDIAAISFFPDFQNPEAFLYLENKGDLNFVAATFEGANLGRWLAMDAGDVDGDGDIDIALGSMVAMPDAVPPALRQLWMRESPSVLLLKNQTR